MDGNIQKYRAFLETVESGSFTKAAEALSYTQSGVSRMIQDMENQWELSLLERNRGGIRLTSEGMALAPHIREVCDAYLRLQMEVDEVKGIRSGKIRIGTFSSVATHWLPNIIKAFQKDYPRIDYELLLGDYREIEQWIGEGRVDCGFLRLPVQTPLDTVFLEEDPLLAILPESHPLAGCGQFPLKDIGKEPFLLPEKGANTEISDFLERMGVGVKAYFTTWDDYAIMSMVEGGLGISILPRLILQRNPYRIVTKELDVPAARAIAFGVKNRKTVSPAVKKFMEYLDFRS